MTDFIPPWSFGLGMGPGMGMYGSSSDPASEPKCPICTERGPWTLVRPQIWRCGSCETECLLDIASGFMVPRPWDPYYDCDSMMGIDDKQAQDKRAPEPPAVDTTTEV